MTARGVRHDYTRLAEGYDRRWRVFGGAVRGWVLAYWPEGLPNGARVLDVGCGTGTFLAALAKAHPGLARAGLDLTPALLARARVAAPGALLVEGNADHPPFVEGSFDVVCSLNVLHHIEHPAAHVDTLARLCRPAGTIFLATFAGRRTWPMRIAEWWLEHTNPAWRHAPTVEELERILRRHRRLTVSARAELRAGRFWRLQLYRVQVEGTS